MKKKLKIGIDINEVLRAKWLQFDRFYVQEFGEEGVPEVPYVYDFFKHYKFEDTIETSRDLKEPEDTPDLNPLNYQLDENGEAPADDFIFKSPEVKKLTAREVYNRFMYEDFTFEIHGSAPIMYRGMDFDVNKFLLKYGDKYEFTLFSIENRFSIPSTLFFLSKMTSRFKNIKFVDNGIEMLEDVDVLITTDPDILSMGVPWGKKIVKLSRPYNVDIKKASMEALQIKDLIDNPEFEKLIKYKNIEK